MGLDMYLFADTGGSVVEHNGWKEVGHGERVANWRKAFEIHEWFLCAGEPCFEDDEPLLWRRIPRAELPKLLYKACEEIREEVFRHPPETDPEVWRVESSWSETAQWIDTVEMITEALTSPYESFIYHASW